MKQIYSLYLAVLTLIGMGFTSQTFAQGNSCDTAIPLTVTINDCVNTQFSTVGLGNSGEFPVGTACVGFNGGDLWLSVVIPPSGEVTITASPIQGTTSLLADYNMAAYSGSCASLTHIGCDEDGGPGFFPAMTLSGTPGSTVYAQFWESGDNNATTFQVCANGTPTCTEPVATFTPQCGSQNEYTVDVNITDLGDATEVSITNDGGAAAVTGITSTGVYSVGPFPLDQEVSLTVVHGGDSNCNLTEVVTSVGLACEHVIVCGTDLNQNYCYTNLDHTQFLYSSPDGSPITIIFNSGLIQPEEAGTLVDAIHIYDGSTTAAPTLYFGNNSGDLTGLTRTATSGHIVLEVISDGGGSCLDGSLGLGGGWDWDIFCAAVAGCESATQVTSQTTFAASEIGADLIGVLFSGANECNGPGTNPDLYFKFTAASTVSYIRATGAGDFDPAIEVFDACGGNQLACANSAGPGNNEVVMVSGLNIGTEYVYRVYHAGATAPTNTAFQTGVRHSAVPIVELRNDFCGVLDFTTNDIVRSTTPNPNTNIDGFVWEFTELEPPFTTYTVNSPNGSNPQFRLFWFYDFQYGRTYSVRIKVRLDGGIEGEYGQACTLGFVGQPSSGLQPQYADGFYQLCDIVKAVKINGATNYRWTFDDGTNVLEYNSNSGNYFCPLQHVNDIQLGTSYAVNVYVTGGGVESTISTERTINMNGFVANTSLNPYFAACGSSVNLTQFTQAFNVCAATGYTFRFENLTQPGEPVIEKNRPNRVLVFNQVPGLIPGDTYSVAVKASAGGLVGDYSSTCEITINAPSGFTSVVMAITTGENNVDNTVDSVDPEMNISPNPVANGSDIRLILSDLQPGQQKVEIAVYDLTGRKVFNQVYGNYGSSFKTHIQLDSSLPTGIYIVRSKVNGVLQGTEKLIME